MLNDNTYACATCGQKFRGDAIHSCVPINRTGTDVAVDSPARVYNQLIDNIRLLNHQRIAGVQNPMEGQIDNLTGQKHDGGKPPMALLSSTALFEIAKVLEFGAKKYDPWNWKGGFKWTRVASAVLRHIFQWLGGEDKDSETGLSHLAHASCGLLFLIDFEVNKLGEDDRYKK
jgi:hypothetical protein